MIRRRHLSLFGSFFITVSLVTFVAIAWEIVAPASTERVFQMRLVFGLFGVFMVIAGLPRVFNRLVNDEAS